MTSAFGNQLHHHPGEARRHATSISFSRAGADAFGDINGDGVVSVNDYKLTRSLINTKLPTSSEAARESWVPMKETVDISTFLMKPPIASEMPLMTLRITSRSCYDAQVSNMHVFVIAHGACRFVPIFVADDGAGGPGPDGSKFLRPGWKNRQL